MTTDHSNNIFTVIGIDCSTDPKKVGIAHGAIAQDGPRVERVLLGGSLGRSWNDIADYVVSLIDNAERTSTLIALDAILSCAPRS